MQQAAFNILQISVGGKELDFTLARRLADDLVSTILVEPMLVAWFDGKKGEEHPVVPECQHKPGWLAYAEGHGGRVRVDLNESEYSFIFSEISLENET